MDKSNYSERIFFEVKMSFLLDIQNWKEQKENINRDTLRRQVDGSQNSALYPDKSPWRIPHRCMNKHATNIPPENQIH